MNNVGLIRADLLEEPPESIKIIICFIITLLINELNF
jgi:hypothetical protein